MKNLATTWHLSSCKRWERFLYGRTVTKITCSCRTDAARRWVWSNLDRILTESLNIKRQKNNPTKCIYSDPEWLSQESRLCSFKYWQHWVLLIMSLWRTAANSAPINSSQSSVSSQKKSQWLSQFSSIHFLKWVFKVSPFKYLQFH